MCVCVCVGMRTVQRAFNWTGVNAIMRQPKCQMEFCVCVCVCVVFAFDSFALLFVSHVASCGADFNCIERDKELKMQHSCATIVCILLYQNVCKDNALEDSLE